MKIEAYGNNKLNEKSAIIQYQNVKIDVFRIIRLFIYHIDMKHYRGKGLHSQIGAYVILNQQQLIEQIFLTDFH